VKIVAGAKTDVGLLRDVNQDAYLVSEPMYVVADGIGGHIAGEVASSTAVDVISDEQKKVDPADPESLVSLIRRANDAIREKVQADPSLRGMGTTCTLLFIDASQAHLAHVGDSRAYLQREGELSQISEDHTLVGRMVQEGRLTPEDAQRHPQRNVITRALSGDGDIDVDLKTFELATGDRMLLCSDGLSGMVDNETIRTTLIDESDPQRAAERLVELANHAGGEDNITVVVIDVADASSIPSNETATAQSEDVAEPQPREVVVKPRSRWRRRAISGLIVLALLAVAAYFIVARILDNSFYVGVGERGRVTIYRGIPEEIVGLSLHEAEQTTDLVFTDLPEFLQDDVEEGRIKTRSLREAEQRVASLQETADSFDEEHRRNDKGQ
jgi:serine/threonine protein phosphatase PrpC